MNKKWVKYGVRLGIMALVVLLFLKWTNVSEGLHYLSDVNPYLFASAILLILFANLIKGFRFHLVTDALGLGLSFTRVVLVNSMCIIVGRVTPGRVGEAFKIVLLDRKNSDLSFGFVLEKIADALTVLIIAILGVGVLITEGTFSTFVNSYILFALILLMIIAVVWKIDKVINFVAKRDVLEERWFWRNLKKLSITDWIVFVFITLLIRVAALANAILIIEALGITASWVLVAVIWNLAIIVGQVSALPGGFGAREAGYTGLLVAYASLSKELAGIAAVLVTVVDLIVESFLAITCWVALKILKNTLDAQDARSS